jgi:hypothetical protein
MKDHFANSLTRNSAFMFSKNTITLTLDPYQIIYNKLSFLNRKYMCFDLTPCIPVIHPDHPLYASCLNCLRFFLDKIAVMIHKQENAGQLSQERQQSATGARSRSTVSRCGEVYDRVSCSIHRLYLMFQKFSRTVHKRS